MTYSFKAVMLPFSVTVIGSICTLAVVNSYFSRQLDLINAIYFDGIEKNALMNEIEDNKNYINTIKNNFHVENSAMDSDGYSLHEENNLQARHFNNPSILAEKSFHGIKQLLDKKIENTGHFQLSDQSSQTIARLVNLLSDNDVTVFFAGDYSITKGVTDIDTYDATLSFHPGK